MASKWVLALSSPESGSGPGASGSSSGPLHAAGCAHRVVSGLRSEHHLGEGRLLAVSLFTG